jgi:hypothetical protein
MLPALLKTSLYLGSTVVSVLFLALRCVSLLWCCQYALPLPFISTGRPLGTCRLSTLKTPPLLTSSLRLYEPTFTVTNSRSFSDSLEEPTRHHGISSCPARTRRVRLLLIVFLFSALFWENCKRTTGQKQSTPCTSHAMRWIQRLGSTYRLPLRAAALVGFG